MGINHKAYVGRGDFVGYHSPPVVQASCVGMVTLVAICCCVVLEVVVCCAKTGAQLYQ